MELKNGMIVKAPEGKFKNVIGGEKFVISDIIGTSENPGFQATSLSREFSIFCCLNGSAHLNFQNWIIVYTKKDITKSITWSVIAVLTILFTAYIVSLFL